VAGDTGRATRLQIFLPVIFRGALPDAGRGVKHIGPHDAILAPARISVEAGLLLPGFSAGVEKRSAFSLRHR